jgi:voltage-gated potassium channel
VPIALAVGLFGLLNLLSSLQMVLRNVPFLLHLKPVLNLGQVPALAHLAGVPQGIAGVVLLVMSVGLLTRSRFAWTITLLLASGTLAVILHQTAWRLDALALFDIMLLAVMLVFYRTFSRTSVAAGTMFGVVSAILLLGYAVFGAYLLGAGFSPPILNLPQALYFSVVTLSTVGYGDIVPKSPDARLFTVSIIILGITVFATAISAVIVPLMNTRMRQLLLGAKKRMKKDHYIVVGDNPLAHNTYRELKARHLPVTVIAPAPPQTPWVDADDLIVGDATDIETLRQAGGANALAILALRVDDSDNAFIVLAAKELGGKARIVASAKNRKNLARLQRVGPDMIIAPDILGGELLAMVLSGESINADAILRNLFRSEPVKSA